MSATYDFLMSLLTNPTPPATKSNTDLLDWLAKPKPAMWTTPDGTQDTFRAPASKPEVVTEPSSPGTVDVETLRQPYLAELKKCQNEQKPAWKSLGERIRNNWDKPGSNDSEYGNVTGLDDNESSFNEALQGLSDIANNGEIGYNKDAVPSPNKFLNEILYQFRLVAHSSQDHFV